MTSLTGEDSNKVEWALQFKKKHTSVPKFFKIFGNLIIDVVSNPKSDLYFIFSVPLIIFFGVLQLFGLHYFCLYNTRIGHLAINSNKIVQEGLNKKHYYFFVSSRTANVILQREVNKKINTIKIPHFIYKSGFVQWNASNRFSLLRKSHLFYDLGYHINGFIPKFADMKFSKEEEEFGQFYLRLRDISFPFVCACLKNGMYAPLGDDRNVTDEEKKEFVKLFGMLKKAGISVVLMGHHNPSDYDKYVIPYYKERNDFLDIYLLKYCGVIIGTDSGLGNVGEIMNKKVLWTCIVNPSSYSIYDKKKDDFYFRGQLNADVLYEKIFYSI